MKRLFFALIVPLTIAGCSDETPVSGPVHYTAQAGDLAYDIQLNQSLYRMDEEIEVTAKVTNLGDETLIYMAGGTSCPSNVDIEIVNQASGERLAIKPRLCTADLVHAALKPGQTAEGTETFIPKAYGQSGLEPASAGAYEVQVSLPPERTRLTEDGKSIPVNLRPSVQTELTLAE